MDTIDRPPGLRAGFHAYLDRSGVPGLVHAGDQRAPTSWLIGPHAHETWEFYLQTHGPATRWRVGDSEYEVPRYGLLAVPPGTVHQMVRPAATTWAFMFAALDPETLLARQPDIAGRWVERVTVCLPDAGAAIVPFEAFLSEVVTSQGLRVPGLRSAAEYLAVVLTRSVTTDGSSRHLAVHPAVARARRLLDTRYADRLRLADLAREVGLSPTYLAELFAEQVGVPPATYRTRARVRRAQVLLTETDRGITDLALELGFSSAQHFATVFRQQTGSTPRAFRRERLFGV